MNRKHSFPLLIPFDHARHPHPISSKTYRLWGPLLIRKLSTVLAPHPMVYYFEQTIGPWDLEVGTVIREPQDLTLFSRTFLEGFGGILS
jgi:hypothetical protein